MSMTEERIDRVLTQYRESPNLLFMLRTYLSAVEELYLEVADLPEHFDIGTATGDQLTILGKRMGWPRCHCVCDLDPVFGFACEGINLRPIAGFCEPTSSWADCDTGISELCLNDDETYRKFLQVRSFQMTRQYDLSSLEQCVRIFFGPTGKVIHAGLGRIVIAPGRDLSESEIMLLQLYPRVLPTALGIRVLFHFGDTRVFGFGEGWGGFMEISQEATEATQAFQRTGLVFGFECDGVEGIGGFCEEWEPDGLPIKTGEIDADGNPVYLVDENGAPLMTGPLTEHAAWQCRVSAPWMCEIDVHPYDC